MSYRIFSLLAFLFLFGVATKAQNNQQPNQSVKITTKVRPIPSLAEQVAKLEEQIEWVRAQPQLQQDGTLAKWEKALADKKQALAAENAERRKIQKQQVKKKD